MSLEITLHPIGRRNRAAAGGHFDRTHSKCVRHAGRNAWMGGASSSARGRGPGLRPGGRLHGRANPPRGKAGRARAPDPGGRELGRRSPAARTGVRRLRRLLPRRLPHRRAPGGARASLRAQPRPRLRRRAALHATRAARAAHRDRAQSAHRVVRGRRLRVRRRGPYPRLAVRARAAAQGRCCRCSGLGGRGHSRDPGLPRPARHGLAFSGSVLLAKDGQVLFQDARGLADRNHEVPNRIQTASSTSAR